MPEIDPGTPLDRPGVPGTSICTKNRHRRPILRPFRGPGTPAGPVLARAIATEAGATFFDLSPSVIEVDGSQMVV